MKAVSLLALLLAWPAHAQVVEYTAPTPAAPPGFETGGTAVLGAETDKLKDAIANPTVGHDELHGRAATLFGDMLRPESSAVQGVDLRGWAKPDRRTEGSVEGMIDRSGNTIATAKFKVASDAPPAPELEDAWHYGRELHASGMSNYDSEDRLGDGTLGAYIYTKTAALGIYFNKTFKTIQRYLGDELAAATAIHEAAHARDHSHGALNAKEVKKGEKQAFETEFKYLRLVDPSGQKLSWARVNFCSPSTSAPKVVCDYLTHLAKISWHGEKGDWDGLVADLGYQDRRDDPFEHHPGDGHQHGELSGR